MRIRRFGLLCLGLFLFLAGGCNQSPPPVAETSLPASSVGRAQPRLQTLKLWLGPHEITAEIARRADEIRTGMMFRTNVVEGDGMLFVFPQPHRASFWMKNVSIPLSCAYLDSEGVVLEIHPMVPFEERPIRAASDQVQYVLEMREGWFERNNVAPGAYMRTEFESLRQTFFRSNGGRGL